MKVHVRIGKEWIKVKLPADPLKAAELVLEVADLATGNALDYPSVLTRKEYKKLMNSYKLMNS